MQGNDIAPLKQLFQGHLLLNGRIRDLASVEAYDMGADGLAQGSSPFADGTTADNTDGLAAEKPVFQAFLTLGSTAFGLGLGDLAQQLNHKADAELCHSLRGVA